LSLLPEETVANLNADRLGANGIVVGSAVVVLQIDAEWSGQLGALSRLDQNVCAFAVEVEVLAVEGLEVGISAHDESSLAFFVPL
jgi:hypothetical protein